MKISEEYSKSTLTYLNKCQVTKIVSDRDRNEKEREEVYSVNVTIDTICKTKP